MLRNDKTFSLSLTLGTDKLEYLFMTKLFRSIFPTVNNEFFFKHLFSVNYFKTDFGDRLARTFVSGKIFQASPSLQAV